MEAEFIDRGLQRRSIRLLNMEYRPAEIAEELSTPRKEISRKQIMRLIELGAPARQDAGGHYWVNGTAFAAWLWNMLGSQEKRESKPMGEDQAYCVKCGEAVQIQFPRKQGRAIRGTCHQCGSKVIRMTGR